MPISARSDRGQRAVMHYCMVHPVGTCRLNIAHRLIEPLFVQHAELSRRAELLPTLPTHLTHGQHLAASIAECCQ